MSFLKVQINKKRSDLLISITILFIVFALRLLTSAAPNVYHSCDTGNIALAVQNYNIAEDRPHLPGYFLHVMIIRLLNNVFNNTQFSMLFLSALYSALGSMIFYKISRKFFKKTDSLLLTLLLTTNPLVWFYGSLTEIYSFDLFFSSLLIYLSMDKRYIYIIPAVFALGAGIRQSSVIILFPFYIYIFCVFYSQNKNLKEIIFAQIFGLAILLAWLIPFMKIIGGIDTYLYLIKSLNPVPDLPFSKNFIQVMIYLFWLFSPFIIILPFLEKTLYKANVGKEILIQFLLIFIPSFLVFSFVHYTRGYWLIAVVSTVLVQGLILSGNKKLRIAIIVFILLQSSYYLFFPYKIISIERFYKPEVRTENNWKTLESRLLSHISVSYSHIKALNNYQLDIQTGLHNLLNNNSVLKNKIILLDPTIPVNERALQASYPEYIFARLNSKKQDSYFLFKDLKYLTETNLVELMNNCIIIGLTNIEQNISNEIEILIRLNSLIFYKARQDSLIALINKYKYYFQK